MKKGSPENLFLYIAIVLIVVWATVSWYAWSDVGSRRIKLYPVFQTVVLPVLIMSWPAHEVALSISGVGFGANVRSAATVWTLAIFMLQAVLTWAPLLIAVIVRKKLICWLFAQFALLLLLFSTFWFFGNG